MAEPVAISDYFAVVDDFFDKKFREEQLMRVAFKARRPVEILKRGSASHASGATVPDVNGDAACDASASRHPPDATAFASSIVKLAPAVVINRDGTAHGRLKVGSILEIGDYFNVYQRCSINTDGKVTVKGDFANSEKGLDVRGKVEVNTLAPAAEDVVELEAALQRNDVYVSGAIARAGNGDQGVTFDLGTRVSNATLGVGLSRDAHGDEADAVMYVGGGFCGTGWSVSAKVERENNEWNSIDAAVARNIGAFPCRTATTTTRGSADCAPEAEDSASHGAAMVAARINLNIPTETTLMDIGIATNLQLAQLRGTWLAALTEWFGSSLHAAIKLSSNARFCAMLSGIYRKELHISVVGRWHLLDVHTGVRLGLQLSYEEES